ncbi:MAG: hypothetical protein ACREMQ_03855 [Longimicrobiales bacterium]
MRAFVDQKGIRWDVVLGRESWGALYALFVPSTAGPVRQTLLAAEDRLDAQRHLDEMDESGLQELLNRSEPKEG